MEGGGEVIGASFRRWMEAAFLRSAASPRLLTGATNKRPRQFSSEGSLTFFFTFFFVAFSHVVLGNGRALSAAKGR